MIAVGVDALTWVNARGPGGWLTMRTVLICLDVPAVLLSNLSPGDEGVVDTVNDAGPDDTVARRLRDLGFVAGESVRLAARGPLGGEPLLVQVGFTRFAMRRSEAARVRLLPRND